jgi:tetratricopeptide (TPR) repeat protein
MPYNQATIPQTIKPEAIALRTNSSPTTPAQTIAAPTRPRLCRRTATKRFVVACSTLALMLTLTSAANSQDNSESAKFVITGQQQLVAARTANTEDAYRLAETSFDRAVQLDPKAAMARVYLGLARMELSGWIARQGRFDVSGEVMNKAIVDLDAAVVLAPDNLQVRMLRGSSYAEFPSFLNKGTLARDDLEVVVHHRSFASQSNATCARVYFLLGRVYSAAGESEKARASWVAAVAADPQSREGQLAQGELEKLATPVVAKDVAGRRMPDRFPGIPLETSPIMVAATVTFPDHRGDWERASLPDSMKAFLAKLEKQPGLLGVHALSSVDHRGMLVILTWWENKQALNNWFYSETHQGIISQFYGGRPPAGGAPAAKAPVGAMGQVGIELFTALPGGMQFGGGLTPARPEKH